MQNLKTIKKSQSHIERIKKSYDPPKSYHSALLGPRKNTFGLLGEVLGPL